MGADVGTELGPLCGEAEFVELVREMCADYAPRRFALCVERGERVDCQVFAWGLEFDDGVVLTGVDGRTIGEFRSAERARWLLSRRRTLRLVWVDDERPDDPEDRDGENDSAEDDD